MRADLLTKLLKVYAEIAEDMRDRMRHGPATEAAEAATDPVPQERPTVKRTVTFREGDDIVFEMSGDQVLVSDDPAVLKPALVLSREAMEWLEKWIPNSPTPMTQFLQARFTQQPQSEPAAKAPSVDECLGAWEPGEREAQAARIEAALEQLQVALGGWVSSPEEGIRFRQCQVRISATDAGTRAARVPRRVTISDAEGVVMEMTDENEVILHCAGRPDRVQHSLRLLAETMAMATKIGVPRDPLESWVVLGTGAADPSGREMTPAEREELRQNMAACDAQLAAQKAFVS